MGCIFSLLCSVLLGSAVAVRNWAMRRLAIAVCCISTPCNSFAVHSLLHTAVRIYAVAKPLGTLLCRCCALPSASVPCLCCATYGLTLPCLCASLTSFLRVAVAVPLTAALFRCVSRHFSSSPLPFFARLSNAVAVQSSPKLSFATAIRLLACHCRAVASPYRSKHSVAIANHRPSNLCRCCAARGRASLRPAFAFRNKDFTDA